MLLLFTFSLASSASSLEDKCFDSQEEFNSSHLNFSKRTNYGLGKNIEEGLEVSTISIEEAHQIFNLLKSKKYIPYDYKKVGCEARAHEMVKIMDRMCLTSAKAFLVGDISYKGIRWNHHVAPILNVKDEDKIIPYIFDPSVSDTVTTLEEWTEKLKRGKLLGYYKLNITNQYIYMPEDTEIGREKYKLKDTIKTKLGLGLFKTYETVDELPEDIIHLLKKVIK
ncbi:MAG: hypothetical protein CES88_09770 [Halobacteriovorax sp. JY17]|nr:MAG: hypothetical protein CES88_09770 [Halobacteriovorax sp. JY17]